MTVLPKTLKDSGFDNIFTEVNHAETLDLKNPYQLRMFYLDVTNNKFSLEAMNNFLLKNIGRYVFSRAEMEQFRLDDNLEIIGAKAIALLQRCSKLNDCWLSEELGNLLLYTFLEKILDAPKLFNKIELLKYDSQSPISSGGIHLLSLNNATLPSYQLVFGKSNITGDLQDALNNAFEAIKAIDNNRSNELRLVESTILAQTFDENSINYLKQIIIPTKNKTVSLDNAFGIFLGYSLGLKPENYSNAGFRQEIAQKMLLDINAHVSYIIQKINESHLETSSFYFYILPFNNADNEKHLIMNTLLNGGVSCE